MLEKILNYKKDKRNKELNKIDIIHIKTKPKKVFMKQLATKIQWKKTTSEVATIYWIVSWKWKKSKTIITDIINKNEHYKILIEYVNNMSNKK